MYAAVQPPAGIGFERVVVRAKNTSGSDIPANRLVKIVAFFDDSAPTEVPTIALAGAADATSFAPIAAAESLIPAGQWGDIILQGPAVVERGDSTSAPAAQASSGGLSTQITPVANGQYLKALTTNLACGLVINEAGSTAQGTPTTVLIDAFGRGFTTAF